MNTIKKLTHRTEFYIFLVIIALAIVIQARSGQFFTGNNIVDLIGALIVPALFSIGTFMIIVSGGIDVSFPALAALVSYIVTVVLNGANYTGPIIIPFIFAGALGLVCGAFNGLFIAKMRLPALIVTLGTQSVFRGILQGALNAQQINILPASMKEFGKSSLFVSQNAEGVTSMMPIAFVALVVLIVIAFLILRYTMLGRGIYAIGGDESSANRAGFKVTRVKFFVYCFAGAIAGITGIIRACMMNMVHPTNMFGMEMTVIAAIVLGGTSIAGGTGSLTGTILGIFLLTMVQNSLIMLGVPAYWQDFVTGMLIIVGTAVSSIQLLRNQRQKKPSLAKAGS
ncbi:MAG: ABC transporter permease [Christensenella sp.]